MLADPKGNPVGEKALDHREIKHIDDLAMQEAGVASFGRKELCQPAVIGRFGENQSVEGAVDNIAEGAGQYEGKAAQQAQVDIALY